MCWRSCKAVNKTGCMRGAVVHWLYNTGPSTLASRGGLWCTGCTIQTVAFWVAPRCPHLAPALTWRVCPHLAPAITWPLRPHLAPALTWPVPLSPHRWSSKWVKAWGARRCSSRLPGPSPCSGSPPHYSRTPFRWVGRWVSAQRVWLRVWPLPSPTRTILVV